MWWYANSFARNNEIALVVWARRQTDKTSRIVEQIERSGVIENILPEILEPSKYGTVGGMRTRLDRISDWKDLARQAGYQPSKLAKICHISPSQLRRHFVSRFGKPPKRWLMEIRLWDAAALISCPDLSLKEIARQLSFTDGDHLSHQFKIFFGVSPSEYGFQNSRSNSISALKPVSQEHAGGVSGEHVAPSKKNERDLPFGASPIPFQTNQSKVAPHKPKA